MRAKPNPVVRGKVASLLGLALLLCLSPFVIDRLPQRRLTKKEPVLTTREVIRELESQLPQLIDLTKVGPIVAPTTDEPQAQPVEAKQPRVPKPPTAKPKLGNPIPNLPFRLAIPEITPSQTQQ